MCGIPSTEQGMAAWALPLLAFQLGWLSAPHVAFLSWACQANAFYIPLRPFFLFMQLEADSEALEALEIGDSASLREALRETAKALGADIAGQPAEEAPSAKKGAAEAASAGGAEGKGTKEDKHSRGKQAGEAQAR